MQYSHLKTTSFGIALLGAISACLRLPAQQLSHIAAQNTALYAHAAQMTATFQQNATRGEYRAFNTGGEPGGLGILIALTISVGLYFSFRKASARKLAQIAAAPVVGIPSPSDSSRIVSMPNVSLSEAPGSCV